MRGVWFELLEQVEPQALTHGRIRSGDKVGGVEEVGWVVQEGVGGG
jgi:hypothetical protein